MGRMANALILVFIIDIAMILFPVGGGGASISTFTQFILTPQSFLTTAGFAEWIIAAIGAVGVGSVIVGTVTGNLDWLFRAGLATTLITYGSPICVKLWQYVNSFNSIIGLGTSSVYITSLFVGVLTVYYIWSVIDYISAKD